MTRRTAQSLTAWIIAAFLAFVTVFVPAIFG